MTLSYEKGEDRMQLAMLFRDDAKARMWLTQRLARALVEALRGYLEKAEGIPLATVRSAMLSHEQARAVAGFKPSKPVRAQIEEPAYLISNIRLRESGEHVRLRFMTESAFSAVVALEKTMLRQWLDMLFRQYLVAGWPRDVWPDWVTDAAAPTTADATRH